MGSCGYLQHVVLQSPPSSARSSPCPRLSEPRSPPCTATGCRDVPAAGAVIEGSAMTPPSLRGSRFPLPTTVACGPCQDTCCPAANATPPISMVATSIPMPTHTHIFCLIMFPSDADAVVDSSPCGQYHFSLMGKKFT